MTDTPERIWAYEQKARAGFDLRDWAKIKLPNATEYVRADIAAPRVKPLVWEDYPEGDNCVLSVARVSGGAYFICDDTDDFTGYYLDFISCDNIKWWQHVRSTSITLRDHYHEDDISPLKAAAQADYEARVLACLEGSE